MPEKTITTMFVFVSMPNGDKATYEILSNGLILQFQACVKKPDSFCETFKFPTSSILKRDTSIIWATVGCSSYLLDGIVNLGYLNESHLRGGTVTIQPNNRDADQMAQNICKSFTAEEYDTSLGNELIVTAHKLQSLYEVKE